MPNFGYIKQYTGPFESGQTITTNANCIIGISVGQKDYMREEEDDGILFTIKEDREPISTIKLGKTFMYQTQQQINNTVITFPNGAPVSTKVELIYEPLNELKFEEEEEE